MQFTTALFAVMAIFAGSAIASKEKTITQTVTAQAVRAYPTNFDYYGYDD